MSSAEVPMKAVSKWFRLETAVIEVADVIGFDNITQHSLEEKFDTLAYVSVQLIAPVAIIVRILLPSVDLPTEILRSSVIKGMAIAFDVIELQDTIHDESLRDHKEVLYGS
jgi:hypothetical protein